MAIDTGIGISITQTSATQQAPLGQTVLKPAGTNGEGEQVWVYVQATEALVVGSVVCRQITAGPLAATTVKVQKNLAGMPADAVVGVAQHAISLNYYGWVLRKGQGKVLTDSGNAINPAVGIQCGSNAPGTGEAAAATANVFAYALAGAATNTLADAVIDCPSS